MRITAATELMKNQKHALVMGPDLAFEALQSQDGGSLFFSIGTDDVFYLTREVDQAGVDQAGVDQGGTGWTRLDLSSGLSARHGGAAVTAKTFAVAANAQTLGVDLALVLTVGGQDFLYLALDHANSGAAWANGVTWTAVPFDAGTAPAPLTIADVLVMSVPGGTHPGGANIFVDIRQPLGLLDRYYITPGGVPQWNPHALDLAVRNAGSCLGRRTGDPVPGIYTFAATDSERELIYVPQYNCFQPDTAPSPARLTLPSGATAIASALNGAGDSNLFVAAEGGLHLFTPGNQHDQATAVRVLPTGLMTGAAALAASSGGGRTAVWWVNPQGSLLYVSCPEGSEASPPAWSAPVPILPSVSKFAFYLRAAGSNVLFAYVDGEELVRLSQDPVTTGWQQRSILLPPTAPDDVIEYDSYTTHVQVTDDDGIGLANAVVTVTATSPVSVYLNDVYHLLSPAVPVSVTADVTGVLTVIQETQSLAGVCFHLVLADDIDVTADVNPLGKPLAILGTVHTGTDLASVRVTNADGSQQPLVRPSVSAADKDAAAKAIAQFVKIGAGLPRNGSRQGPTARAATAAAVLAAAKATAAPVWGLSFAGGGLTYHEGRDAVRPRPAGSSVDAGAGSSVDAGAGSPAGMPAGDFFQWAEQVYDEVSGFVVQPSPSDGACHFLATIGGQVYDVVLDCVDAIVHATRLVFSKIKVFLGDLMKWLGFVFEWPDILRTHRVMKNIFTQYTEKSIAGLGTIHAGLQKAFASATDYIKAWTGIPDSAPHGAPPGLRFGVDSLTRSSHPAPGMNTPQSNWGLYHLKSNTTCFGPPKTGFSGDLQAILRPLADALAREEGALLGASDSLNSDIIGKIHDLSLAQIIKGVFAILTNDRLESIENVLLAAIDVLAELSEGAMDLLTTAIEVPVISSVYRRVTGDDLSLLDLVCLVAAIPATIGYELAAGAAPFPDDTTTAALINAPDFASLRRICGTAQARLAGTAAPLDATSSSAFVILEQVCACFAFVGALSLSIISPKNQELSNPVYHMVSGALYYLYVSPDIFGALEDLRESTWWASANREIATLMTIKANADMCVGALDEADTITPPWDEVSAWLDLAGNLIWQVPATGALFDPGNDNIPGSLNFAAGTCFDMNGWLSPALYYTKKNHLEEAREATVVAAGLLNGIYGTLTVAAAFVPAV